MTLDTQTQARRIPTGRSLMQKAVGSLGTRVLQAALGLAISMLLARLMSVEDMGLYASLLSLAAIGALPVQAGVARATNRDLASLMAKRDIPAILHTVIAGRWLSLIAGVALGPVIFGLGAWITLSSQIQVGTVGWRAIAMGVLAGFAISLVSIEQNSLFGLRRVITGQLLDVSRNIVQAAILGACLFLSIGLTSTAAISLFLIASAASAGLGLFLTNSSLFGTVGDIRARLTRSTLGAHGRRSLPFIFLGAIATINAKSDIFLISGLSSLHETGLYQIAAQISALALFVLSAVSMVSLPWIAQLHEDADRRRLQMLLTRTSQAAFLSAIAMTAIVWLLGPDGLGVIFRPAYATAWGPLMLLLVGQSIQASTGSVAGILVQLGHVRWTLIATAIGLTVKLGFGFLLVPTHGAAGAAIATLSEIAASNLVMWVVLARVEGLSSFALPVPQRLLLRSRAMPAQTASGNISEEQS